MTTPRERAWAVGKARRALIAELVAVGLDDAAVRDVLDGERADLLPAGRHGSERLTREITKSRAAHDAQASGDATPEAVYLASLKRQLRLIEASMARSPSPDLANLAHRLVREIGLCEGVSTAVLGPGGKPHMLGTKKARADAGTTPDKKTLPPTDDPEMVAIHQMMRDTYKVAKDGLERP